MTLKHASAFVYGIGFGIMLSYNIIGEYTLTVWGAVAAILTIAYVFDRRAAHVER